MSGRKRGAMSTPAALRAAELALALDLLSDVVAGVGVDWSKCCDRVLLATVEAVARAAQVHPTVWRPNACGLHHQSTLSSVKLNAPRSQPTARGGRQSSSPNVAGARARRHAAACALVRPTTRSMTCASRKSPWPWGAFAGPPAAWPWRAA